jgi:hypothetical protein
MDLIEVLQQKANIETDDAMTFQEIMEQTGWYDGKLYRALREKIKAGIVEPVYVQRPNILGTLRKTPAYRIVRNGN